MLRGPSFEGRGGSAEVGQKVQVCGVWNIIFASEKAKFHSKRSKWKYIPLFITHLRKISSMYLQQFSSKSQGHLTHISRSNFKHNSRMPCALILNEFDKSWKKFEKISQGTWKSKLVEALMYLFSRVYMLKIFMEETKPIF